MKLQGVFMIIPLLAVAVSGSTIPSKTSYSVQRLEKRGDDDPASKGSAPKNTKVELAVGSEPKGGARSKVLREHLSLAKQLEEIEERWVQHQDVLQIEMDKNKGGDEELVKPHGPLKKYPTPQHGADNDDGKEPARLSNIVEIDPTVQRFVTRERNKIMNSIDSFKATRRLRDSMRKNRPAGSSNSLPQHYRNQHSVVNIMSGPMDKSNQGEMTFRDAFKKNHPGNQAQSSVRSKYISQEKTVDVNDILNALKMSHDHSHGTSTGPEQIDNDYQKMAEEIRKISAKKSF
ncbi:hypothetical protein BASA50_000839 [Batrachochytrium salamandrivorans]|uniref:Uncharacterized protein n=1 Tax=Batrachochytrium salamandrivorans TaxID=1357716 RepID=A0ABQ8EVG8_9FUNG|nr:hypothetical protein BASA50_000839 [Batrachochytrium salamandrivorans]KAH6593802.1 hypothetical protein BASA61_004195 [Batrachochytrium salamandrivorans]KAH9245483.1 hypothetical protein BASA81_017025 [Batrachochytrium salamandrivorans]